MNPVAFNLIMAALMVSVPLHFIAYQLGRIASKLEKDNDGE